MKLGILISLIVIIAGLLVYIYRKYTYIKSIEDFKKKYNLFRLRNKIQIERLKTTEKNELTLKWPKWKASKEDGTLDISVKNSDKILVTELSTLVVGNMKITSNKPQYIYNIALKLRECGVDIPRCKEEQDKITGINIFEKYIEGLNSKLDIYDKFKGKEKDFNHLCKILFTESDIDLSDTRSGDILLGTMSDESGESVIIIKCKLQDPLTTIEKSELQEFNSISKKYDANIKILITTGRCNKRASNYSERVGIKLVDSEELMGMIKSLSIHKGEKMEVMEKKKYDLTYYDIEKYYPKDMQYDWDMSLIR